MNLTDNILRAYRDASADHHDMGMVWYTDAHNHATAMGDVVTAAGVIAALSPNTPWDRNLRIAYGAMESGKAYGTLGASVAKADRIMAGESPLDVLGGHKVRSFYANILDPDDTRTVTIDRHAYDIAVGVRNGKDSRPIGSLKQYATYVEAYRAAATRANVLPWQIQAVTWEYWRSIIPSRRGAKS